MVHTLYELKPAFQALLRPAAGRLAAAGVTANQITLATMSVSVVLGAFVAAAAVSASVTWPFLLLPVWFASRMAFNAIDGILAREFGQRSALGAYQQDRTEPVDDNNRAITYC